MPEKLRREIVLYVAQRDNVPRSAGLFRTQKSPRFSANTLYQTLSGIYQAAGIEEASSHPGRRGFITTLASKGEGVHVLAALAGHRSIATTQVYIDVHDEMKRATAELVA